MNKKKLIIKTSKQKKEIPHDNWKFGTQGMKS